MNPTDRDLLIEIRVYTSDKGFEVSTGYPVARDRILTARHGLFPAGCPVDAPIRLRWHHQSGETREFTELPRSAICWQNDALDSALIDHAFPKGLVERRYLSPVRPFHDERWSSEGFPLGGDISDGGVTAFPVAGRAHGAASNAERFHLGLDDGFKQPKHWGGISGAPVFVRGQVVGVIVSTPTAAESRLKATPSAALFAAEGFKDAIGYDREAGRIAAVRAAVVACLQQSEQARLYLGKALSMVHTEPQALARRILDLPTPESVISIIKDAYGWARDEREVGAAAVLRELALTAVPARFDSVVVETIRGSMVDPERTVLTPPICTATGAEIAMAGADEQPARFKPVAGGYDYPDGELSLNHPPNCGMEARDNYFKEGFEVQRNGKPG